MISAMQKGQFLHFDCLRCRNSVDFSIFDLDKTQGTLKCSGCGEVYSFQDETLIRQLRKFENLCKQIVESEEILSDISVGVDIDGRTVRVPYKILLARLSSTLDLTIGDQPLSIDFRLEPIEDLPHFTEEERKPLPHRKIPLKFSVDE
ncbi:MAG: hypothetical protein KDK48_02105 [Chlamydiia bacterium]|nr:hypothetical protein [Chlamydiia bacterium]